ncbi:DUF6124 family protein [Pseudomonas hygromyciniae]
MTLPSGKSTIAALLSSACSMNRRDVVLSIHQLSELGVLLVDKLMAREARVQGADLFKFLADRSPSRNKPITTTRRLAITSPFSSLRMLNG